MKFDFDDGEESCALNKFPSTGTWMTPHQFNEIFIEKRECCHCDKKATWIPYSPEYGTLCYCDDHWPYGDDYERESDNE
jgi:hypothetical protein